MFSVKIIISAFLLNLIGALPGELPGHSCVVLNSSCTTGKIQYEVCFRVGVAYRKDLHGGLQNMTLLLKSVGQAAVQLGKVRLLCHSGNRKP